MREVVFRKPSPAGEFFTLQMNVAGNIVGMESYHQSARVGPGLTAKITEVVDGDTRFLHHLAMDGFFKRFACFDKSGNQTIEVTTEIAGMYQQYLFLFACLLGLLMHQYDDGSSQLRPHLLAAVGAAFGDIGVQFHGCSANAAVLGVEIPIQNLLTFAGFQVKVGGELVVGLAEAAHFILGVGCWVMGVGGQQFGGWLV